MFCDMDLSNLPACDAPLYKWDECEDEEVAVVGVALQALVVGVVGGAVQALAVLELGLDPGAGAGVGTAAGDAT